MRRIKFMTYLLWPSLLLIHSTSILGQSTFNSKYKAKTKFTPSKTKNSKVQVLNVQNGANQKNVFGRKDKDNKFALPPKNNKYVNLNPETAFGPDVVQSFNFENQSLTDLTKFMQELTGINLILDKDLKGKISIIASQPITVGEAWKAYLTALNINGYTLVKSGAFYKIVNARDIRYTPTKIYTGSFTPDTENYVMKIMPLKNISSTEVTRSFRPFMSRFGRIIDIKQTNTVIVQDTGSNIKRLSRLIRVVDVPGHEESLHIITVQHSSAQEIVKLLKEILKQKSGGSFSSSGSRSKSKSKSTPIIAEPRTNSIITMTNAAGAKELRDLIKKLDIKDVNSRGGQIHVYYLNHGNSEALAKTLTTLVSNVAPARSGRSTRSSSRFSSSSSNSTSSLFSGPVKLTSDKDNNALVVTASPTDYLTIKNVIKKLDVARDQVYVEGLIMETQVSRLNEFGIGFAAALGKGNASRAGFNLGSSGLGSLLASSTGGLSLGGLFVGGGAGKAVTVGDQTVNTVNGLIKALARNTNANILATPQLTVLDNVEGIFEVGESVPNPTTTSNANGTTSVSQGTPQKISMSLKITPQINKVTRFIKLKIDMKIDDFSNRPLPAGLDSQGVATTNRQVTTEVVVRDRDTIAMGGLMRDKETLAVDKVPLLGDIPVLGWLFRNTRKAQEKINMLLFLTPKILDSYEHETAETIKDLLSRRSAHLKKELGENDPFGTTVKGLYRKAQRQQDGPLYDTEKAGRFKRQNDGPGIGAEQEEKESEKQDSKSANFNAPDYQQIIQNLKRRASSVRKKRVR